MAIRVFDELPAGPGSTIERSTSRSRASGVKQSCGAAPSACSCSQALETPAAKVQTIHAFCTQLLQQFPFEANVAARFQVLEETQRKQKLEDIRMGACSPPPRARQRGRTRAGDQHPAGRRISFQQAVPEAIREHQRVMDWVSNRGGVEHAMAELSQSLGIEPDHTIERLSHVLNARSPPRRKWTAIDARFLNQSKIGPTRSRASAVRARASRRNGPA